MTKKEERVRLFLREIGEDITREGLKDTPRRVAELHESLKRLEGHLNAVESWLAKNYLTDSELDRVFNEKVDDLVMVRNIMYDSRCEHHLLPFYGYCHIAYIARGKVFGASKLVRVVRKWAGRLQMQERLTKQIADEVYRSPLRPKGVMVIATGRHLCMTDRGVNNETAELVTSALRGLFLEDSSIKLEVLRLLSIESVEKRNTSS
ncbi:MAG: GTP cyclohydrolase I [Thaumarchaeota archaeon]|nr:GTP cyclohydrolase I [Nitrososphaerota archaeon]